jgi:CTP-dependent riboflavin kinase
LLEDNHEHHNTIKLAGGSTSVSGLSEGTYYVAITLSEYNNDPENCRVNGSLTIDAT